MGINIKNERTQRLARQLAGLTGENLTTAITVSVEERLARIDQARTNDVDADLVRRIGAIGADCRERWTEPLRTADPGDLLHDDDGLPR